VATYLRSEIGRALVIGRTWYKFGMANDADTNQYYVRATDPTSGEQIAFACPDLAIANAKSAELRMSRYRDVIISVAKPPEDETSTN
jgi:hypothetical protein